MSLLWQFLPVVVVWAALGVGADVPEEEEEEPEVAWCHRSSTCKQYGDERARCVNYECQCSEGYGPRGAARVCLPSGSAPEAKVPTTAVFSLRVRYPTGDIALLNDEVKRFIRATMERHFKVLGELQYLPGSIIVAASGEAPIEDVQQSIARTAASLAEAPPPAVERVLGSAAPEVDADVSDVCEIRHGWAVKVSGRCVVTFCDQGFEPDEERCRLVPQGGGGSDGGSRLLVAGTVAAAVLIIVSVFFLFFCKRGTRISRQAPSAPDAYQA